MPPRASVEQLQQPDELRGEAAAPAVTQASRRIAHQRIKDLLRQPIRDGRAPGSRVRARTPRGEGSAGHRQKSPGKLTGGAACSASRQETFTAGHQDQTDH